MSHIVAEPTGTVASGESALQEGGGCTEGQNPSPVAKILRAPLPCMTEKSRAPLTACVWVCCRIGFLWQIAHSLNFRKSFLPIVSSELDRERELMRGEVDGWDSGGTSEREKTSDWSCRDVQEKWQRSFVLKEIKRNLSVLKCQKTAMLYIFFSCVLVVV